MLSAPNHIAIIMDGNGRWALQQGLPRNKGHQKGIEIIKDVIEYSLKLKIKVLTFYCFSTENWNRPKSEVDYLMNSLRRFIDKHINEFTESGVKARVIGDKNRLSKKVLNSILKLEETTSKCDKIVVNFAINYGSKDELVRAFKNIAKEIVDQSVYLNQINENLILERLDVNLPVDLLIRTSGEQRLSNFLLYQSAYAELYFTNLYWPDFNENTLIDAINQFNNRKRRFGGLTNEN